MSLSDLYHFATADRIKYDSRRSYASETLTRLGTALNFTCPPDSFANDYHGQMSMTEPDHGDDCPTAFIVGARKGGTTSLYQYLSKHPNFTGINLDKGAKAGETMFFQRNKKDWEEYTNLFPRNGTMTGESSVGNLVKCDVPHLIRTSCGQKAKIVMVLRNPTNRFISNFLMRARLGTHTIKSATKLITEEMDIFSMDALDVGVSPYIYVQHWDKLLCLFRPGKNLVFEGLYYAHVMNWLCNFPPENVLIANSEDFFARPNRLLREVIEFLGLEELDEATLDSITTAVYNEGSYDVRSTLKVSNVDREKLAKLYDIYNQPLLELLGWKGKLTWN